MTRLIAATDDHFAWLVGERSAPDGLSQPSDGVDDVAILKFLRRMTARLHEAQCRASWLIVDQQQVVGLCSFKRPPDAGLAEIGYGVAASRQRRGYATHAVRLLIDEVVETGAAAELSAQTAVDNIPSIRVLEANGFSRMGTRSDPADGELILWSRACAG
ncbi:GNAT family N-acetyltransferase [Phenylobacterium sp.]|uniref:GNAT family N-acetyltransferase n=1 Tax=Phenylobacterium sp. TaxID=1871053 RepID=UPI002639B51E|nr:GNAT family N-acetyltransferase [Phenylobacterium sp.]